ncbi:MAG: hypothetical protein ACLFR9_07150 [Desulfobacterales bacterium]
MRLLACVTGIILIAASAEAGKDHSEYMKNLYEDGPAVTDECLQCHQEQADDFMESAHWLWQGPSPHVAGIEEGTQLGKRELLNNY